MKKVNIHDLFKHEIEVGDVIENIDFSYEFPKDKRVNHIAAIRPYFGQVVEIIPVSWVSGGKDWFYNCDTNNCHVIEKPFKECNGNILKIKWDGINHDYLYINPHEWVMQDYYNKKVTTFLIGDFKIK